MKLSTYFSQNRMSIALKLPLLFVVLALVATATMGIKGYFSAYNALLAQSEKKLQADTAARAQAFQSSLSTIHSQITSASKNPAVLTAIEKLTSAFSYVEGDRTSFFQDSYIKNNPFPVGQKHQMDAPSGRELSFYDSLHNLHHPFFRDFIELNGYYDLFLINTDGDVVYSVFKELDYATNLNTGEWAGTDLAKAFQAASRNGPDAEPVYYDYHPYGPSNDAPASFIAMPVHAADGESLGVIAFQMPTDRLAEALRQTVGLGKSEEAFVVGADNLMRTDSRFTEVNDLLETRVDAPSVEAALNGEAGIASYESWHGGEVIAAYQPVSFLGTQWAVVMEESREEILEPTVEILHSTLINIFTSILVVAGIGFLFARSITRPLGSMACAVNDLAGKNYVVDLPGLKRGDEIGAISRHLETLRAQLAADADAQQENVFKSAAFETSAIATMMSDSDMQVVFVNRAARDLFERCAAQIREACPSFNLNTPTDNSVDSFHTEPEYIRKMLKSRDNLPFTTEFDMNGMLLSLSFSEIIDENGEYAGNSISIEDITLERTNSGILDAISQNQCIIEYDMHGNILSANENYVRILGMDLGAITGQSYSNFALAKYMPVSEQDEMWRKLANGEFISAKQKRVARGGEEITLRTSLNGIKGSDGQPYKVIEIASDITELEKNVVERRQTLDAIGRNQAMIEFTPDGTIRGANENFLSAMGYSADEVVGKHHSIFITPEDRNSTAYKSFWTSLAAGQPAVNVFKRIRKDGSEIYIQAIYNPVLDEDGQVSRILKCANDVTDSELKRMKGEEILRQQDAAQSKVVDALTSGLEALASGELTIQLSEPFEEKYEQLRQDFNTASKRLLVAMQEVVLKTQGISGGAAQISQGADDLATRTERQASSLEETASAIEEMTASVDSAAGQAETAEQATQAARSNAEAGEAVVQDTIDAMGEINHSAEKITEIIGVIDDIAFQTNLLALNAGVEAARAGEAGRGFAVVASEVRALAQRCSDAAKEIKTLISESGDHVKRGVDLVGRTGSALKEINNSVVEISGLVSTIFKSSKEQSLGLADINSSVAQLDQVTQQNAAMVQESTAASHELTTEAMDLASLVSKFKIDSDALEQALVRQDVQLNSVKEKSQDYIREEVVPGQNRASKNNAAALQVANEGWEEF